MAQQQIITKPYVGELQDNDSLFINHDGALRQVKKEDADLASSEEVAAEVAAREAYEAAETAAREAFEADIEEQMSEKANVDGYYEEMTVGDAEQLVATQFVEDNEPYLFRSTGGSSDVGNRAYLDKIIGGTLAVNQLIPADKKSASKTFDADTAYYSGNMEDLNSYGVPIIGGHKYIVTFKVNRMISGNNALSFSIQSNASENNFVSLANGAANGTYSKVVVYNTTSTIRNVIYSNYDGKRGFSAGDSISFDNLEFTDLTQFFCGSTIADYVYNLEQSTAGSGVAWLKQHYPGIFNSYQPYNAGELMGVEASERVMTGFNQWDEEWEVGAFNTTTGVDSSSSTQIRGKNHIPIIGGTEYYFNTPVGIWTLFFDKNKNPIPSEAPTGYATSGNSVLLGTSYKTITAPASAHYARFYVLAAYGTTYNNDICINISSSDRNGEYEEYVKHSYPLDNSLTLRGIPKLDSFNNLYYDGDEYEPDGTVTRVRKEIIFDGSSDEGWITAATYNGSNYMHTFFRVDIAGMKTASNNTETALGIMSNWAEAKFVSDGTTYDGWTFRKAAATQRIYVLTPTNTTNTIDLAAFKAKLAQTPLIVQYDLATPTTEEAEPYQQIQIVDDFGTEEFVSNSIVPVGHTTEYPANLRDKLQHLPDLAGMDGTYLIRQIGNQMSLVYMPAVFPEIPTEDGTYTLKTVVASGVATLQWVAD